MSMTLKNVAAVQSEQADLIGHLFWYSLSEMLIKPDELRKNMKAAGLDEGWMPRDIRLTDAFRRATSSKLRQQMSAGAYENYMYREVASDKVMVERHLVCETVDTKGRRLDYRKVAALVLDKKNGQIDCTSQTPLADQLAQEAVIRFHIYREHYSGSVLRTTVMNILKSMSPTPVRPAGGVYFVPKAFEDRLAALCRFVRLMDRGEAERIPLINTLDTRGMVTRQLHEHLTQTLRNCEEGLTGGLRKDRVKEIIEDAKQIVSDYKQYQSIVTGDLKEMEDCIGQIRGKVAAMLSGLLPEKG